MNKSWIFDVEANIWRQHTEKHGYCRTKHSGIIDLNGNVLIIGGKTYAADENLIDKYPSSHKSLFSVTQCRPVPKTLERISVKKIYKHRTELNWKILPPQLIRKLMGTAKFDDNMKGVYYY